MILARTALTVALAMLLSAAAAGAEKKVLLIDAYHEGYAWSDSIIAGAQKVIGAKHTLKIVRMDSKRNPGEEAKKAAALKVKEEIDSWKPDVVIACDDNASKYVIVPFFKDKELPVVFCGINWDASIYGFPCGNVTGMVEVSLYPQLLEFLKQHAKGTRVGSLGNDNETEHKEADNLKKKFKVEAVDKFVKTFEEWKTAFLELQASVDMLLITNNAGIKDWNDDEAKRFLRENTKVPTGSCHDWIAPFVLACYAKLGSEQGEWAAGTAIQILEGKAVKDIPVVANQKGDLHVNLAIAQKLGVKFPLDVLKTAKVIKD